MFIPVENHTQSSTEELFNHPQDGTNIKAFLTNLGFSVTWETLRT